MDNRSTWHVLRVAFYRWLARHLPRGLVYQCALRLGDHVAPSEAEWNRIRLATAVGLWGWSDGMIASYWKDKSDDGPDLSPSRSDAEQR